MALNAGWPIIGWARTPVAPVGGALRHCQPHDLGAPLVRHLLAQAGLPADAVDAVVLGVDVERAQRINHTLSLIPPEARAHSTLRPVDVLMIVPSQRIDDIAARHVTDLPVTMRTMLGALGVTSQAGDVRGAALVSYLLFEQAYTRELMDLGRADTLARRAEVCRFFGWNDPGTALPPPANDSDTDGFS